MCIWLTHTRMPSILCLVKLSQVESEVVNSSVALADRFFLGCWHLWMNLTGIVCKFESECLRNSSSMLELWQVGLPNLSDHSDHWRHFPVKQSQRTPPTSGMYLKKKIAEDLDGQWWTCSFWLHTVTSDYSFFESTKETNDGPPPSAVGFSFMPDLRLWVA